jgi:hydroxyacylglutathione hydrolase
MTTIIPIPAFRDNYIWAVRNGANAAVVDPGDAAPVLAWLDANGVQLCAIIATHHHADHVGGVPELRAKYDVPVFGPAREAIPQRTHALSDGDRIDVPGVGLSLALLDIPGHTAGHIAYYTTGDDPLLFCGDTLFAGGCGRIFEGTPEQMWTSLSKLAALPAWEFETTPQKIGRATGRDTEEVYE